MVVDNCTTFDELTPNAFFDRVVLDLSTSGIDSQAIASISLSFREEISDIGALAWFDLIDDYQYAGLKLRAIKCTDHRVTREIINFAQALDKSRLPKTHSDYRQLKMGEHLNSRKLFDPSLAPGRYNPVAIEVRDIPFQELFDTQNPKTYMTQEEENASIIKSFEINLDFTKNEGEYFGENANTEHLSFFVYAYIDFAEAARVYNLEIDLANPLNKFPYGQISFVNVLGEYRTGTTGDSVRSGPGQEILCDLRALRRFRNEVDINDVPFSDTLGAIATGVDKLTLKEINKLTGDQGHFTEFFHSKDQKDNIRFLFGVDVARLAKENCAYPILLRSPRLVQMASSRLPSSQVFELKDMRLSKVRLRDSSRLHTELGGDTSLEIFSEDTDYTYVAGLKDFSNPLYREARAGQIEQMLVNRTTSSQVNFYTGKDNLKKEVTAPGIYQYRLESTYIDHSPELIKSLAKILDRQVRIIRQAHNQLAGRHVFNERFVNGEDQPGAIATQTMGGFFLKERGTTLQIQQQTFANIQEIIRPAAAVIADISDEVRILAGIPQGREDEGAIDCEEDNPCQDGYICLNGRCTPLLSSVINNLLRQIRPDATGEVFKFLVELADIASYLAGQFRKSVNRALVDFTDDEDRGTLGSGTAANVVGGKRFINDFHDFDVIVKNLKTQKTGVDLISWSEQNDQDYGLKGYGYDLYQKRVDGEVSKFYARGAEPRGLDNLWSYLTPARIKMAGRKPMSPLTLGNPTNSKMYSYEQYADLEADLYDYKFNAPRSSRYHVHEPSYAAHKITEDRNPPEHYSNKTITQLLNQHCEVEIEAGEKSTSLGHWKTGKSGYKKGEHPGGIGKVFGDPADSGDEATSKNAETGFGDKTDQWNKNKEDHHKSIGKYETKTGRPMVTRIFYTLMGEMVLTPTTTKYADAKFNAFAGIEDDELPDLQHELQQAAEEAERELIASRRIQDGVDKAIDKLRTLRTTTLPPRKTWARGAKEEALFHTAITAAAFELSLEMIREFVGTTANSVNALASVRDEAQFQSALDDWSWGDFGGIPGRTLDTIPWAKPFSGRVIEMAQTWSILLKRGTTPDFESNMQDLINHVTQEAELLNSETWAGIYFTYPDAPSDYEQVDRAISFLHQFKNGFRSSHSGEEDLSDLAEQVADRERLFRELPIQLRALTDMSKYIARRQNIPYNQPFVDSEPYREIPIERSMLAIIAQEGGRVDLAKVYDIMKDHSKFAPFWYNFKHIYEIQYLVGFDNNIKSPIWQRLTTGVWTEDAITGESSPTLCRIVGYENEPYGVAGLGTTSLPIYNNYFFLEKKTEASISFGQETPSDLFTFEPSFTPREIFVPLPQVDLPAGVPSSPQTAVVQGNSTAFFGANLVTSAASVTDFSDLKFDATGASNAGLTNPPRDLGMVGGATAAAVGASVTGFTGFRGATGY